MLDIREEEAKQAHYFLSNGIGLLVWKSKVKGDEDRYWLTRDGSKKPHPDAKETPDMKLHDITLVSVKVVEPYKKFPVATYIAKGGKTILGKKSLEYIQKVTAELDGDCVVDIVNSKIKMCIIQKLVEVVPLKKYMERHGKR